MLKLILPLVVTGTLYQIALADPIPTCKDNEEFIKCGRDGCLKYFCSDLDLPPLCRDGPCVGLCECKDGFLRASYDNDTCVPIDQCERKCKDNEQLSDCPSASCMPQTCKDALYPYICPPWSPGGCPEEPGCICSYGYLRDESGICIPKDECPRTCKENEEFSTCANSICYQNCDDVGKPCPAIPKGFCNSGCICKDNFLRNKNGTCVPQDQCDQNES